ncbi:MAG: VanZ family protein [Candidatus Omnitrophota bacterium]|jgi:VanZ family protein|nr:VanZ family protein [Candidatus Omnitrophota bacterium]
MINFARYRIPFYVYAAVIFFISSLSNPIPEGITIPFFDKILHVCEYMVFGFLAARAFKNSPKRRLSENFYILAIAVSIVYGLSDEIHQFFIAGREFSVFDIIADGTGATLGAFIYPPLKKLIYGYN